MNSEIDHPAVHICMVQKTGQVCPESLHDAAQYIGWQIRRLGFAVSLEKNMLRRDAINLVIGAVAGVDSEILRRHCCLIVNLEQLGEGGAAVGSPYLYLLHRAIAVDYDVNNLSAYLKTTDEVPIIGFGHAAYLNPDENIALDRRPIDLLFFGSMNERRAAWIRRIEQAGRKVTVVPEGMFGGERDALIRQSKAVLNLHYYETARFEQVRAFLCLSNGTPVLSERHVNAEPGEVFEACVTWFDENQVDQLFGADFGTPLFYQVMQQQIDLFKTHDPLGQYDALMQFALGVWQVQYPALPPAETVTRIGPAFPAPVLP